ncbi:MAG: glycerol-3-phosphate 1-O-acyltransferase PlsY [Erysipelotrichaceae bacterium]|nr:glycerol-3-phosphate 1-O-acyltransferase PlsY [Erysipelotrichaceae bacterium]
MKTILVILISYLFGSVPWALVIGKLFYHKDIRQEGSGNLGASNAGRVLGKHVAVIVTVLDALKAFFSMLLAHYVAPGAEIYAGLACCIGHCFPVFAQFKGGKAVATSYGFLLGIAVLLTHEYLLQFVLPVVCFFVILYLTKMVSVSSIGSLLIEVIVSFIMVKTKGIDISIPVALLVLWAFVTYRHKSNLERVMNGTESKIKWMG